MIKQLAVRYGWAIALIGSIIGFLVGNLWHIADFGQRSRTTELEQTRVEKEFYERLQLLQNEISAALPRYIELRDQHYSDLSNYPVQNGFNVLTRKLVNLIGQYNTLEVKLAMMEGRPTRWFVIPVPPIAPQNTRIVGSTVIADILNEPLQTAVHEELKSLIQQYRGKVSPDQK